MEKTFFGWLLYIIQNYGIWFLKGTGITLLIAITGTAIGFLIGLCLGAVKTVPLPHNEIKRILMKIVNGISLLIMKIILIDYQN